MEKVHRAEDYFRKVIYDKLHFYYICKIRKLSCRLTFGRNKFKKEKCFTP